MAELRDKGIEIANDAVAADTAGHYEEAISKYIKASEYLLTATKYEKNPVTLKTLRGKCLEYTSRAEMLKKGLDDAKGGGGKKAAAGGGSKEEEEEEDDDIEPEPLTEEQLRKAEQEMEAELNKLVGMESVKTNMRKLCKQLSLDLRRRQQGHAVLDAIRHMMFTGTPRLLPARRANPDPKPNPNHNPGNPNPNPTPNPNHKPTPNPGPNPEQAPALRC